MKAMQELTSNRCVGARVRDRGRVGRRLLRPYRDVEVALKCDGFAATIVALDND